MLRRALQLHEPIGLQQHDVGVDAGVAILEVGEVEPRLAVHDADRHRGHQGAERGRHCLARGKPGAGIGQGHAAAGDARGAGAAVGLEHVAVDLDGELAEGEGAHRGAERAADEALDLLGASAGALALATGALDRGAGEHGVLGRHPALAGAALVRRRTGLDATRCSAPASRPCG